MRIHWFFTLIFLISSCQDSVRNAHQSNPDVDSTTISDATLNTHLPNEDVDETWVELRPGEGWILDIRYAGDQNFTKRRIYDCGRCYLRPEAADLLEKVRSELWKTRRLKLKLFDCYRPSPAQDSLWAIFPNPAYVTPPHKGSMHSRGMAIDLTLTNAEGKELDMGTPYDYFGVEAHTDFLELPDEILKNRGILSAAMAKQGFRPIRTEWWHFSLPYPTYTLSDWAWTCD